MCVEVKLHIRTNTTVGLDAFHQYTATRNKKETVWMQMEFCLLLLWQQKEHGKSLTVTDYLFENEIELKSDYLICKTNALHYSLHK